MCSTPKLHHLLNAGKVVRGVCAYFYEVPPLHTRLRFQKQTVNMRKILTFDFHFLDNLYYASSEIRQLCSQWKW